MPPTEHFHNQNKKYTSQGPRLECVHAHIFLTSLPQNNNHYHSDVLSSGLVSPFRTVQLTPQPARALRDSALAQTATRQRSYKPAPTSRRCDRCSGTRSEGSSPPGQEDSREGASLRCQRQQLPGVSLDGVSHEDHKPFQHACPWPLSSHSDALPKGNTAQRTALPSLLAPTYGTSQGPSHLATPPTILDSASRTAALRWNSGMPPGSPLLTGCPVFKATSRMITKPTL